MSVFEIPHEQACPECGRPALEWGGELHCAKKRCEKFGEVIGR